MALNLLLPFLLLVAVTEQTINLDLGNGVKKAPTPYIGAAGLTPFLGFNPYTRSIGQPINLELPHFDVKKVPSAYIGANGLLTPFIGINPYLRSIGPPAGSFSPAMMPYGPAVTPPLGLYQQQRLSLFGGGYANGAYCAFDSACASKDCYYFSCSPSLKTGEKCREHRDCAIRDCRRSGCAAGAGEPCSRDDDCYERDCSGGICATYYNTPCKAEKECHSRRCVSGWFTAATSCGLGYEGDRCFYNSDCSCDCNGGVCGPEWVCEIRRHQEQQRRKYGQNPYP